MLSVAGDTGKGFITAHASRLSHEIVTLNVAKVHETQLRASEQIFRLALAQQPSKELWNCEKSQQIRWCLSGCLSARSGPTNTAEQGTVFAKRDTRDFEMAGGRDRGVRDLCCSSSGSGVADTRVGFVDERDGLRRVLRHTAGDLHDPD
jgi:hypothetical protein